MYDSSLKCQASNSGQLYTSEITTLKQLNFLSIVTVHVVSVMYVQKEVGEQVCTCIKYVISVFKNMSKSLKSVRL
jgi:hypothetical protein